MTITQKKEYAFILYTQMELEQNVVAQKSGVSIKTISKWVNENDGHWKKMRSRLLVTRESQINTLYDQLENLNKAIAKNEDKHPDTKQADVMIKLTAAIRNMEVDLNIGDIVQAGLKFIKYAQKVATMEQVMEVSELWNAFIQSNLK